jgi:hypothetical protein
MPSGISSTPNLEATMREATVKLYKYSELPEEVKEKVRDWYRGIQHELGDYTQAVSEFFRRELQTLGYPTKQVYWSLSNCQGDGMAFYGPIDRENLPKIRNRVLSRSSKARSVTDKALMNSVASMTISDINYHYNHYNSMSVSLEAECGVSDKLHGILYELAMAISDDIKEVSKDLENKGYKIIEDMEEDEYIDARIEAQDEWEFYADGELWNERG